jgi:16S rRNA (adenine1518-N6/adenine1519-N6)-dimethyltransferase
VGQADGQGLDFGLSESARRILYQGNLHPKKALGQVFLQDLPSLRSSLEFLRLGPGNHVLEIGSGVGNVTEALLATGAQVIGLEIDQRFRPVLTQLQSRASAFQYRIGNASQEQWDEFFQGGYQVFGNLPYYLSSSLLEQLLEREHRWERAAFLLQKEVVERLVAKPESKAYSALTILSDFHAKLEKGPIVGRHSFYPVPQVDSQFLHLTRRDAPPVEVPDRQRFCQLVRGAFAHRRKTLLNNLLVLYPASDRSQWQVLLDRCGLLGQRRGESLTIEEFARLARAIEEGATTI